VLLNKNLPNKAPLHTLRVYDVHPGKVCCAKIGKTRSNYDIHTDPVIKALIGEATADPDVIGLVLIGSRARRSECQREIMRANGGDTSTIR
jgi:hypothetical protein